MSAIQSLSGVIPDMTRIAQFSPNRPSPLRYSSQPHALTDALALGKIGWIITPSAIGEATDRKTRIKRKTRLCSGVCLIQ